MSTAKKLQNPNHLKGHSAFAILSFKQLL